MILTNINQLWLISGRCWGDDDDTVHIVEADTENDAVTVFTSELRSYRNLEDDDDLEIFVNVSQPLKQAIYERLPPPVRLAKE